MTFDSTIPLVEDYGYEWKFTDAEVAKLNRTLYRCDCIPSCDTFNHGFKLFHIRDQYDWADLFKVLGKECPEEFKPCPK